MGELRATGNNERRMTNDPPRTHQGMPKSESRMTSEIPLRHWEFGLRHSLVGH